MLHLCLALSAVACKTRADEARPDASSASLAAAPAEDAAAPPADASALDAGADGPVEIDLAFAGDVLPHGHVLESPLAPLLSGMPRFWHDADARVFNLEAPIGERDGLEGLALAAPPGWLGELTRSLRPSAFVTANNHSCDRDPQGVTDTMSHAERLQVPVSGMVRLADADGRDAFMPIRVVEKRGRAVCLVAWTAFLNDAGENLKNPRVRGCVKGDAGAKVAYLPLGEYGEKAIHRILGAPSRFAGCDARIAYMHAGNEYRPQLDLTMLQARAAALYMDAVIVSHPHVPDAVTVIDVANDAGPPRRVPVFRSLGNFISNQGADWTPDKTGGIAQKNGQADQGRTAWTRVAMLAKLGLRWLPDQDRPLVRYGFSLLFTEREHDGLQLRAFPGEGSDEVAERLRRGPQPFAGLLDDPCRLGSDQAALPCPTQLPTSQTTQGTTTKP